MKTRTLIKIVLPTTATMAIAVLAVMVVFGGSPMRADEAAAAPGPAGAPGPAAPGPGGAPGPAAPAAPNKCRLEFMTLDVQNNKPVPGAIVTISYPKTQGAPAREYESAGADTSGFVGFHNLERDSVGNCRVWTVTVKAPANFTFLGKSPEDVLSYTAKKSLTLKFKPVGTEENHQQDTVTLDEILVTPGTDIGGEGTAETERSAGGEGEDIPGGTAAPGGSGSSGPASESAAPGGTSGPGSQDSQEPQESDPQDEAPVDEARVDEPPVEEIPVEELPPEEEIPEDPCGEEAQEQGQDCEPTEDAEQGEFESRV